MHTEEREFVRLMAMDSEKTTDEEINIEKAYGVVAKVVGEATKGATVKVHVNFTVKGRSLEQTTTQIKKWCEENGHAETFNKAWHEKEVSGKAGASFLFGLINIGAQGSYRDGWQKSDMKITNTNNQFAKDIAKQLANDTDSTVNGYGDIEVTGLSNIAARGSIAVEIMTVTRNGKKTRIVNAESLQVVDAEGNIVGKQTGGKLKLDDMS